MPVRTTPGAFVYAVNDRTTWTAARLATGQRLPFLRSAKCLAVSQTLRAFADIVCRNLYKVSGVACEFEGLLLHLATLSRKIDAR